NEPTRRVSPCLTIVSLTRWHLRPAIVLRADHSALSLAITPCRADAGLWETEESGMSKPGLDNGHRNKDGEISGKHGNTLIRTLRKVYGQSFAAGYPETEKLSEVLLKL